MPNPLKQDPSRTTMLRRRFMADMQRRFRWLQKQVKTLVVTDDAFGLNTNEPLSFNVALQEWRFRTDSQKIDAFNKWFKQQVDQGILTVSGPSAEPWTNEYVGSAYKKGVIRVYTDTHAEALAASMEFYEGTKEEFLRSAFASPEAISKIQLIYTRTFNELQGVTNAMGQQMSRILADGIAHGKGAIEIARNLDNGIKKINRTRALVLARTEVVTAHAEGQLDSFEKLGLEEVGLLADISTAGDDKVKVCERCESAAAAGPYTIEEARGMISFHPN